MQTPFNMIFKLLIFICSLNSIIGEDDDPFLIPNDYTFYLNHVIGCPTDTIEITKCFDASISGLKSTDAKTSCCAGWDFHDCIDGIKGNCKLFTETFKDTVKKHVESVCNDKYPYGSSKCRFPWWGTLLIVLGALFIIGIFGSFVFKYFRNKI